MTLCPEGFYKNILRDKCEKKITEIECIRDSSKIFISQSSHLSDNICKFRCSYPSEYWNGTMCKPKVICDEWENFVDKGNKHKGECKPNNLCSEIGIDTYYNSEIGSCVKYDDIDCTEYQNKVKTKTSNIKCVDK